MKRIQVLLLFIVISCSMFAQDRLSLFIGRANKYAAVELSDYRKRLCVEYNISNQLLDDYYRRCGSNWGNVGLALSNWMFDMHDLDVDWDGDHVHVDDGGNHNEFRIGVNLGAGAEFALGRNWAMNVEFRYQLVDDFDQGVINFGAAYRF